jgi:hypothetical protein
MLGGPYALLKLRAAATRNDAARWDPSRDIADARNAHSTNTPAELLEALEGSYDHFEGDVRIAGNGRIVMAHDRGDTRGLTLDDWLEIGKRSGRALKLDFKDGAAILPALERAKALGIRGTHLVINVSTRTDDETLRRIRAAYPDAWINLSPGGTYDSATLRSLARQARRVGGKVQFPLRWDRVTPQVVRALAPYGRIAIWNDPRIAPADLSVERARLRAMGVDGTIDLRR